MNVLNFENTSILYKNDLYLKKEELQKKERMQILFKRLHECGECHRDHQDRPKTFQDLLFDQQSVQ